MGRARLSIREYHCPRYADPVRKARSSCACRGKILDPARPGLFAMQCQGLYTQADCRVLKWQDPLEVKSRCDISLALALPRSCHQLELQGPEALGFGVVGFSGFHVHLGPTHWAFASRWFDVERHVQTLRTVEVTCGETFCQWLNEVFSLRVGRERGDVPLPQWVTVRVFTSSMHMAH